MTHIYMTHRRLYFKGYILDYIKKYLYKLLSLTKQNKDSNNIYTKLVFFRIKTDENNEPGQIVAYLS